MSRPIKFRAWNKHSKKMFNVLEIWFKENTTHPNGPVGALIDTSPYAVFCEFDVLELMQFTGLKDKTGKEIWEEDIVETFGGWGEKRVYEVKYCDGYFSPLVKVEEGHNCLDGYEPSDYKVLGNVYEHPELLT